MLAATMRANAGALDWQTANHVRFALFLWFFGYVCRLDERVVVMRIGVFCSGGDAPGMNACTRAVVRTGISEGHQIIGINRGYTGLLAEDFFTNREGKPYMTLGCVSGWSRHGGTFLRTSRSDEFRTEAGVIKAAGILRKHRIDALIPIGGDGTFRGCVELAKHWDGQIVGLPGTIDNDLNGTDYTIGFSTAVQTAVDAVDKIHDTASSHERMFLVEVMGRHCGYIATYTAIASGAEVVAIPETLTDFTRITDYLKLLKQRGKSSIMMIVAEGDEAGGAVALDKKLQEHGCAYSTRVVILGHLQRGGQPTPEDRIRSTIMGEAAVRAVLRGENGVMVGLQQGNPVSTPLAQTFATHRPIPPNLLELLDTMSW
jgi:6-phosphofructokinase 1